MVLESGIRQEAGDLLSSISKRVSRSEEGITLTVIANSEHKYSLCRVIYRERDKSRFDEARVIVREE
jgi:hypothetical protein